MILVVVGIPGVGKSACLGALKAAYPFLTVVSYAEMMLKQASIRGIHRDALRQMPIQKQAEIGLSAAVEIEEEAQGVTVVDTHGCIKTPFGYCPGLPLKVLNALNPQGLVMVQCDPELILKRRQQDSSRQRDQDGVSELALHQELTRAYLAAASVMTGAPLCIVNNDGQEISENIKVVVKLIESLSELKN